MKLRSSPKGYKNYKCLDPAKTVSKIIDYLKKRDFNVKYYEYVQRYGSSEIYYGKVILNSKRPVQLTSGKGTTKELCQASAYSELIERLVTGYLKYKFPETDLAFNSKEIENKKSMDTTNLEKIPVEEFFKHFHKVSFNINKLDPFWADYHLLTEDKYVKAPTSLIREISSANGLASGNTYEEAITQAFCEVCERYSLIKHLREKLPAKTIALNSINNQQILDFINLYKSLNVEVKIKDFSLGNNIPVMGVLFINKNVENEAELIKKVFHKRLFVASAFDLETAIIRCFTEHLQMYGGKKELLTRPGRLNFYTKHWDLKSQYDIIHKYYSSKEQRKIIDLFKEKQYISMFRNFLSIDGFRYLDKDDKPIDFSTLDSIKTTDFLDEM